MDKIIEHGNTKFLVKRTIPLERFNTQPNQSDVELLLRWAKGDKIIVDGMTQNMFICETIEDAVWEEIPVSADPSGSMDTETSGSSWFSGSWFNSSSNA